MPSNSAESSRNYHAYLLYTLGLIAVSHLMLVLLSLGLLGHPPLGSSPIDWVAISLFLGLGMIARAMSLNAMGVQISIDSVVYTAAAFHMDNVLVGWVVFVGIAGFDLCKIAAERDVSTDEDDSTPWWMPSLRSTFSGSISAVLVVGCSFFLGIGAGTERYELGELTWMVPLFVSLFLGTQYSLAGLSFWLREPSFGHLFRKVAIPSFLTEFSLVPVTVLMVLLFERETPGKFLILSAICLSFIFVLRRVAVTSSTLLSRIRELEIVNTFGHMMSSTLDADFLADRIADGVLSVYSDAKLVVVARPDEGGQHLECLVYDGVGQRVVDPDMGVAGPIAQWVMDTGSDVRANMGPTFSRGGAAGSGWIGTPIISMGEVVGGLLCQTGTREAKNAEAFRMMELVSRQAAVALHNSSLYEQATVDGLTRLFVRRYFDQRLDEEFHRAQRYKSEFSVVMIDVDDFKAVNDTFLHETGDKILQMVAAVIRNCIRAMDVPCRLGGDEFAIILPESNEASAKLVGERICAGVRNISLTRKGRVVSVTVSVGVAGYPSSGAETPSAVMQKGDIALYRAKAEDGKNRVFAHSDTTEELPNNGESGLEISST